MCTPLEAARQLGARPVLLAAWHRSPLGQGLARRALREADAPFGPFLPAAPAAPAPALPPEHAAALLARARAVAPADWHGPFAPQPHALALDLFAPGDIRPVWERNRWAELPLLAQAARLESAGGHLDRAEDFLAAWLAANPPYRGPNWACGQEAALRALHLALAIALLGGPPPPGARALLALHGRRIAATPAYAKAQDNNHSVSEPAGLLVAGLFCGEVAWVRHGRAGLAAALARLVAPDGAFAQLSTLYHRLLLDVLAVTAWLAGEAFPAAPHLPAAVEWLRRLTAAETGATPWLGHQDGSAFADLALAGPEDARPSLERAARLLAGHSAGWPAEPGCAWLGLPAGPPPPPLPAAWTSSGLRGWQAGRLRAFLRTGPLRFRPGHADLLHLDLWNGSLNLLRDGGTGAYNPPPGQAWWHTHLTGTAAHNTVEFDGEDQMPRLSRFLFGRWPRTGLLPEGGWLEDHRGRRQERLVRLMPDRLVVEDRLSGPFRRLALRWRLAPAAWEAVPDGVASPLGRLLVRADGPLDLRLEEGAESPRYGIVRGAPVLVARGEAGLRHILSEMAPRIHP
ncbi:heparinase II/III-family protein [Siccirubricoccus sp. KC 17139]|uniref:Heparinase II/III-family protein n=1 Tax=Siccirubricoccus soli TaxID=2899147 RepID=A0ABT1CYL7_9PROT|nr:heparinase II/III-family protein [Siccirubricoccus soli]MCO6414751.1 heparinase II/III-family protein [Siccirubricoccus soli]MCP2680881.1 heparinase II/III-family protein [Siccirubricoccus soli]